jgi:hypothetical protein
MQTTELYRHEVKIATNSLMLARVRSWLRVHLAGFYEAYPCRQVNNVYFDTPHLRSYSENLSGVAARRKVRVRWYGEKMTEIQGVFEVKRKRNMHGWKLSQPLSRKYDLSNSRWVEIIAAIRDELGNDLQIYLDDTSFPTLINKYQREYYVSGDGIVRATLDYSQSVFDQRYSAFPNLQFAAEKSDDLIIEFKANSEQHRRLAEVVADIPLRVGRYSKYIHAVESLLDY